MTIIIISKPIIKIIGEKMRKKNHIKFLKVTFALVL